VRVLVTGATGFLGTALVDRLAADGCEPVGLVRAASRTDALDRRGVPTRVADLRSGQGLAEALGDVDAVVHAAGGGHALDVAAIHANNTGTTRTLLDAVAAGPPLKRFVLVSSLAARGPGGASVEGTAPITHYGRSKAAAEALTLARKATIPVTIARPPSIYGPEDWRMLPLYRAARRGWIPLPGPSRTASMIHVRDCVSALSAMVRADHPSGRTYFVEDGVPQDTEAMARRIGAAVGRARVRVVRVPSWVLRVAGAVSEGLGRVRGKAVLLHRDKVRELLQPHWVCSAASLRDDLGWAPEVGFDAGVEETAANYLERGLIA